MTEWIECTLDKLGEIVGGATPSTKCEDYYGGSIPWITPKDLSSFKGRYITSGERNITEKGLASCSAQMMPKDAVLFTSRAPIGYVAIASQSVCTNQGFKSIVVNEKADPLFVYYLLKYNKDAIEAMGSGTTFKEVSGKTMRAVKVRIPLDVSYQKRIAAVLDSLDTKIENNERINDNLEATIQAAFDKAFHDAGVSLPETIIKQNKVPQGWTDATVGDFASVQTGPFGSQLHNEDYVESGTPIITVEHMDGKYIAHRNLPLVSQNDVDRLRKYDLHTGDIVFSRVGSVDRAVMVSQHEDGWLFSGRCLRVRPYDPNTGSYFLWWFNQPVIRQLVTASAVGATMPSINTSILNSIRIVFPQKDIVTQFCKMADGLIEIIATNLEEIRKLNDAREYIQLSLSR